MDSKSVGQQRISGMPCVASRVAFRMVADRNAAKAAERHPGSISHFTAIGRDSMHRFGYPVLLYKCRPGGRSARPGCRVLLLVAIALLALLHEGSSATAAETPKGYWRFVRMEHKQGGGLRSNFRFRRRKQPWASHEMLVSAQPGQFSVIQASASEPVRNGRLPLVAGTVLMAVAVGLLLRARRRRPVAWADDPERTHEATHKCGQCGGSVGSAHWFCPQCGAAVQQP